MTELGGFYDALDRLRDDPVTRQPVVLWLGDSHTAADFMTHEVRRRLQEEFGDAGPGFVRLGLTGYRHGAVRLELAGKWRKAPILPAQRTRVLDGVFGYGGIRTLPSAGASVTVKLSAPATSVTPSGSGSRADGESSRPDRVRYTLAYRAGRGSSLAVKVGGQSFVTPAPEAEGAGIIHAEYEGAAGDAFTVAHRSGSPEVFGVYIARQRAGVIFDTVGIDGARAATVLAWEPDQYAKELQRRSPALVVLAFGTNEVFDETRPSKYAQHYRDLIERVRSASPTAACWIVGPPDALGKVEQTRPRVIEITEVQRQVASELGCGFSSAFSEMGGPGSFRRWIDARPTQARTDGIHLTILGYQKLGALLGDALLGPRSDSPRD